MSVFGGFGTIHDIVGMKLHWIISGVLTRPQKRGIGAVVNIVGVDKILKWNIQLVAKITCTAAQLVDFPAPGRIEDWKGGEGSQLPGRMGWYQPQLRQLWIAKIASLWLLDELVKES